MTTGATPRDVQTWMSTHQSNFTSFMPSTVPFNGDIDARSMQILSWVDWVKSNPPQ